MNIRDVLIRKKEKLRLDLNSIHSPSKYGLSFYTSESFKSNEVRDFTRWVAVPPSVIDVSTYIGERLIPSEIKTIFSNNVTSITFDNGSDFASNGLHVSIQRIQPQ